MLLLAAAGQALIQERQFILKHSYTRAAIQLTQCAVELRKVVEGVMTRR